MKKNYFFSLLLLLMCITTFAQTTVFQESFEGQNSGIPSITCNDGSGDFFTVTDGTDITSSYLVSGQDGSKYFAAMDTDATECGSGEETLIFNDIDISTFTNLTFAVLLAEDESSDGKFDWDAGDLFYIEVDYDNSGTFTKILQFATTMPSDSNFNVSAPTLDADFDGVGDGTSLTSTFQQFTAIMSTATVVDIKLTFFGLGAGDEDIAVDNIRIIDGFIAAPSVSIAGASDSQTYSPEVTQIPVIFNIQNFTLSADNGSGMSDNSGDGFIKTTLEITQEPNEEANFFTTVPPAIEVTPGKGYRITAELVDNSGNSLDPAVTATVTFDVAEYNQVTTLAELRVGTEGEFYDLSGEVILTYARSNRNQKYVQDASAGILIDDSAGIVTTIYSTYDGITGLKGQLGSFGGVLQFLPTIDFGAATSSNNSVVEQAVSLADYVANFENYESELIKLDDIVFADAGGTFASSTNYDITSGQTSSTFRTNFSEADYIGEIIPSGTVSLIGFGAEFNGTPQIVTTKLADILLSTKYIEIKGFNAHPNPVSNGNLTITTNSNASKKVAVFNILGKQILSESIFGTSSVVNVSTLTKGIYILKVTEDDKIATQKLVIK